MNKSLLTNLITLAITLLGFVLSSPALTNIGLFALSGAFTNWLAVHMLFEKVPFLYGSGVIEAKFDDFRQGIKQLIMDQFFSADNLDKFLTDQAGHAVHFNLEPIIAQTNFEPAYDSLVATINESKFGGMLAMFGGAAMLEPLKEPFISKLKIKIIEISNSDEFSELIKKSVEQPDLIGDMQAKVSSVVEARLSELTPVMVKTIIQNMIKNHLGWLVVWGGFFGGLFGLVNFLINQLG